jgi:small subunit ribosomal protein S15
LNKEKREERQRLKEANRPHVVLGTIPGRDDVWQKCDLAKVLIDEETLVNDAEPIPTPMTHSPNTVLLPKYLGHGVGEIEKKLLFQDLPRLSAEASVLPFRRAAHEPGLVSLKHTEAEERELAKANTFGKLLDLRNANARGIAYENRRRIIAEFSEPDKPFDTGRPEVQGALTASLDSFVLTFVIIAALLTYKIRNLWAHLTKFKRDVGNRRSLRKLVHQRAKILKYLKRLDRDRYDMTLNRLALDSESVEGELVV